MIDLKKKRFLEPIANKWLKWVCNFFYTVKPRAERPWLLTPAGGRVYFDTYAEKLYSQLGDAICSYARGNVALERRLLAMARLYMIRLKEVVLASPAQLDTLAIAMRRGSKWPHGLMTKIKNIAVPYYESLVNKHGLDLVEELNIKTCPYCNRQFVFTFEGIRAERPELDHFYPKALFPLFCLSFYNLIPVCHSCNHVKLENEIGVNPYARAFNSRFVITDKNGRKLPAPRIFKLTEKDIRLKLDGKSVEERINSQVLGIENVYNKHTDYVKELIDKSVAYDTFAQKVLVESFQGAGYHPRQVYDFVWGKHLIDAEYEDRPLSKLTKDVLDLLGIRRG